MSRFGRIGVRVDLHASSAIDTDDLAVDPVTVTGGKEADDTGNVDGLTDTAVGGPCGGVLIDLVVAELVTIGNVLTAHGVVHVGLDSTGGNGVDGDLLGAGICRTLAFQSASLDISEHHIPTAMQRTKVSMAPLEPE